MPEDDLKLILGRIEGRIDARMDAQDKTLGEIHNEVRRTNGRVTALEMDSARKQGADAQRDKGGKQIEWWVGTLIALVAILSSAGVALAIHFLPG